VTEDGAGAGPDRRQFLKRAAIVAGVTAWTAPVVQSIVVPASAQELGSPPPASNSSAGSR
jgi:hypothetical protein